MFWGWTNLHNISRQFSIISHPFRALKTAVNKALAFFDSYVFSVNACPVPICYIKCWGFFYFIRSPLNFFLAKHYIYPYLLTSLGRNRPHELPNNANLKPIIRAMDDSGNRSAWCLTVVLSFLHFCNYVTYAQISDILPCSGPRSSDQ